MAPTASVQESPPSQPPLLPGPIPTASTSTAGPSEAQPTDVPIKSLGEDDDEDEDDDDDEESGDGPSGSKGEDDEEEWDPSEERLPGQSGSKDKGKGKEKEESSQPWQAVWAPEQNAWYFWNAETGQVTWTNPLEPAPPLPTEPAPEVINPPLPKEAPPLPEPSFGQIPDIDPDLAYLLPATQRGGAGGDGQQASFNARTGKFQSDGNYAFDHLDEYNRAKRMAGKYFDVDSWEKNLREENAKRKRDEALGITEEKKITKKDMERFKKKKAEQKYRKQAWLRD